MRAGTLSYPLCLPVLLFLTFVPIEAQPTAVEVAASGIGQAGVVPAATLLLPYFEVDFNDPQGAETVFTINNASAHPALAHVVLWTDTGVPTLDFDVYLTGFDAEVISLREVFVAGTLPFTAFNVSNEGIASFPSVQFPGCAAVLPLPSLPQNFIDHIRGAHTGLPSAFFGGLCSGIRYLDGRARGYVTIDSVNHCSLAFPDTQGYFADGGTGIANNDNILWGDVYWMNQAGGFSHGSSLVHIQAHGSVAEGFWKEGDYTFYGRYVEGDASDNREPLATNWTARYVFDQTDLICWRDSGSFQQPFQCGTLPFPFPMTPNKTLLFDDEENPYDYGLANRSPFFGCPWATGRYLVDEGPWFAGWLYLNLNFVELGSFVTRQSYLQTATTIGSVTFGSPATALDNALHPMNLVTDFYYTNGFESGGTFLWTLTEIGP